MAIWATAKISPSPRHPGLELCRITPNCQPFFPGPTPFRMPQSCGRTLRRDLLGPPMFPSRALLYFPRTSPLLPPPTHPLPGPVEPAPSQPTPRVRPRALQLQNQESVRALLKRTEAELSMRVSEAARRQEDPLQRQRTLVEEERLRYLNDEELITQQLK